MIFNKRTVIAGISLIGIIVFLIVMRSVSKKAPSESVKPTNEVTATPNATPTPTPTKDAAPTPTATATPTPTEDVTPTPTPEATKAPTPTNTPTATPVPTIDPKYATEAKEILDAMTLDEKIYQLFITTPEQLTGVGPVVNAYDKTKKALEEQPVGGIVYAKKNVVSEKQTKSLLSNTIKYSKYAPFLAIDDPTGSESSAAGTKKIGRLAEIGASKDASKAQAAALALGGDLRSLGFNLNLSLVADIDADEPVLGNNVFGSDRDLVSSMVAAYVKGSNEAGIVCAMSHFPVPGTGKCTKSVASLQTRELMSFLAGVDAGASVVIVGYANVSALSDQGLPACLCPEVLSMLRNDLEFNGIIMTSPLDETMITKNYKGGTASVAALQAGADFLYRPADLTASVKAIKDAIKNGSLTEARIEESVLRILSVKLEYGIIQK